MVLSLLATAAPADAAPRVLFLGNSLTATNDLPALVAAMATLQGVALETEMSAPGGYALEDHWQDGATARLASGRFTVVILQQGPSTQDDSRAHLRAWTARWAEAARQAGARPALFMVWPREGQPRGFALVGRSYREAAAAAGIALFPVGETWAAALEKAPGLSLYTDVLHPTRAGSFLAAMVIARRLVALDPVRVPPELPLAGGRYAITPEELALFRSLVTALPAANLLTRDLTP